MKENILVTSIGGVIGILTNMGQEVFTTLFLGMVGAFGGLVVKEVWNYVKRRYGKH